MGLFDDDTSSKGEVRLGVSDEEGSRLEEDVRDRMTESGKSSGDVTLEDIHRQNEKIIGLLEKIADGSSRETSRTDKGSSSGSHRVTERSGDQDREDKGGGMDELL